MVDLQKQWGQGPHWVGLFPFLLDFPRTSGWSLYVSLAMLNERLSGVRIPNHPRVRYRDLSRNIPLMDMLEEALPKLPQVFQSWIASPNAYTEIAPELRIPQVTAGLSVLEVTLGEIVDMMNGEQRSTRNIGDSQPQALFWWHAIGMPVEMLSELLDLSEEEVEDDIAKAMMSMLNLIGFRIFAHRAEVACIIGGDTSVSYLKRLLSANKFLQSPIMRANSEWRRCIMPLYSQEPALLRKVAGTGTPYESPSLIRVRPWRESIE